MAFPLLPGGAKFKPRPSALVGGQALKVAILGSGSSLWSAPVEDPSWLIVAHASMVRHIPGGYAPDLIIDIHPPHCFMEQGKNGFPDYYTFLRTCRVPILMQKAYPEIPSSIRFPREQIKQQWNIPVGSQTAWLIGYYLMRGATHFGFWGVHYDHGTEYEEQRASTEHWIGIARGRGCHIVLPKDSPLCREPKEDYGYESHDTLEKYERRKQVFLEAKLAANRRFSGAALTPLVTPSDYERAAATREANPWWAREIRKVDVRPMPKDILDQEAKDRARGTHERAARLHGDAGLPASCHEPEGAPLTPFLVPDGGVPLYAGPGGSTPEPGDRVV